MFAGAKKVLVAKGKKVASFAPGASDFDAAAFRAAVIGPSGNLRAPTLRLGKVWIVGFAETVLAENIV